MGASDMRTSGLVKALASESQTVLPAHAQWADPVVLPFEGDPTAPGKTATDRSRRILIGTGRAGVDLFCARDHRAARVVDHADRDASPG